MMFMLFTAGSTTIDDLSIDNPGADYELIVECDGLDDG